jgi:hypothetical protein
MKKVLSLATAVLFMASLAIAQQGPTPAKNTSASKEGAKKECSGEHKSCCGGKTASTTKASESKCSGEHKSCCGGHKAEAASSKSTSTTVKK